MLQDSDLTFENLESSHNNVKAEEPVQEGWFAGAIKRIKRQLGFEGQQQNEVVCYVFFTFISLKLYLIDTYKDA